MVLALVAAFLAWAPPLACRHSERHVPWPPARTSRCYKSGGVGSQGGPSRPRRCRMEAASAATSAANSAVADAASKLRDDFLQVFGSRRRAEGLCIQLRKARPFGDSMSASCIGHPNVCTCWSLNNIPVCVAAAWKRFHDFQGVGPPVAANCRDVDHPDARQPQINMTRLKDDDDEWFFTLSVEKVKPVREPLYQGGLGTHEAMESCPREDIKDFQDRLIEENLILITETGEQGRLPVLILRLKVDKQERRPAIVFLHSSYKTKEWVRPLLEAYASRGYITVAIDSRYHGERAHSATTYRDALVSAWKNGDTMPFLFDTVWDLIKLGDYLTQREDIDPARIGITGESLGGMHAWLAAAADTRYSVVVPIIGVQGFRWAIDNDKWHARVESIKPLFEEARNDLGKSVIDKEVVEKAWDRIAPGLASQFDSPNTIPAISPRPLLILNGAEDPRCPLAGLDIPVSRAVEVYEDAGLPENFKLVAEPGVGHQVTSSMVKAASDWFDRFLLK